MLDQPEVLGAHGRQQHRDPAVLEVLDQVPSACAPVLSKIRRRPSRRITTSHVADLGQLEQEALRGAEEERAVEAVGDDVLV